MKKKAKTSPSFTHDVPEADLRTLAQFLYHDILDFYQSDEGKQYRAQLLSGSEQTSQNPVQSGLHIQKAGVPYFQAHPLLFGFLLIRNTADAEHLVHRNRKPEHIIPNKKRARTPQSVRARL